MPLTIHSRSNPRVKHLRAAFARQSRLSDGLLAIEGEHLLQEALRSGVEPQTIFVDERSAVPAWVPQNIEHVILSSDVFASAVDTQSPQGIAALLEPPAWTIESALKHMPQGVAPLLLIAAGLQDPGNLGALVRSAEAFGAHAVLTTFGTVSCWNQKALRASAGSAFRMPVIGVSVAEIAALKRRGIRLYAAAASGAAAGFESADPVQSCALMIGNEGAGLDDELFAIADERIAIPMPGPVESLNAAIAGSLLLYEASRRRAASHPVGRK